MFRLMTYFLIISLLPVLVLSIYLYTSVSSTLTDNLSQQGDQSMERIILNISNCIEDYRHRSYRISVNELIRDSLTDNTSVVSASVYQQLYQIMRGTIYDASAHLISADGRTTFSTHEFPSHYDLRHYRNDVSLAATLASLQHPTLLLTERYTNSRNDIIMMNLLRTITDEYNRLIGYVVIDIFSSTLSGLCTEPIFSDVVLIDRDTLKAFSLLHTDAYGDYSRFPALTEPSVPAGREGIRTSASHIIVQRPIENTTYSIAGIIETDSYTNVLKELSLATLIIVGASMAAALMFAFFASKHVSKPVSSLVGAMKRVEQGNLDVQIDSRHSTHEIKALKDGFNKMIVKTRELLDLTKQEEQQLREAERKALQAQINPHFLYNTLYTIKALATLHGEKQILEITTSLGKLLRNAISSSTDVLPLRQSIELVEHYLRIVRIRFPDKLRCNITIHPSCLDVMTPKLIIQPFVENAVTHGLEPKLGNWYIRVDAFMSSNRLIICIRDNGIGFDPDQKFQKHDTDHVGIRNVRQRLELFYRDQAEVRITSRKHVGTVVRITLPME